MLYMTLISHAVVLYIFTLLLIELNSDLGNSDGNCSANMINMFLPA